MERIPLHSWQMGLSIQYHVTIINQLNDLKLMGYYIKIAYHARGILERWKEVTRTKEVYVAFGDFAFGNSQISKSNLKPLYWDTM